MCLLFTTLTNKKAIDLYGRESLLEKEMHLVLDGDTFIKRSSVLLERMKDCIRNINST